MATATTLTVAAFERAGVSYTVGGRFPRERGPPPPPRGGPGRGAIAHSRHGAVRVDEATDHVYLAAEFPWEAYYIGRIMGITAEPPEDAPTVKSEPPASVPMNVVVDVTPTASKPPSRRASSTGNASAASTATMAAAATSGDVPVTAAGVPASWSLLVRVAWFQRAKEVAKYTQRRGRARAPEAQLLLASMHSDMNPADAVRGKCTVTYMGEVRAAPRRSHPVGRPPLPAHMRFWRRSGMRCLPVFPLRLTTWKPTVRFEGARTARHGEGAADVDVCRVSGALASVAAPLLPVGATRRRPPPLTLCAALPQRPDHFYYWLLYDRFTHALYDVIPTAHVRHLPPVSLHALKPFKYVLCESGKLSDFAELCRVCKVRSGARANATMDRRLILRARVGPPRPRKPMAEHRPAMGGLRPTPTCTRHATPAWPTST